MVAVEDAYMLFISAPSVISPVGGLNVLGVVPLRDGQAQVVAAGLFMITVDRYAAGSDVRGLPNLPDHLAVDGGKEGFHRKVVASLNRV